MLPASTTTPATTAQPSLTSDTAQAALARRSSAHSQLRDSFALAQQQEKGESSVPYPLQGDLKYRKYALAVDKTLQAFDNVNEWADFITFLAKLLKARPLSSSSTLLACLQSAPQFPVIPHKLIVAKRLSQCLNPALPTGVHQRALDVYTHILTTIGPENLRRDLPAWSSGLFPFFQYAATSVKPIVLNIYERFYLPLQEELRPATKAFILALLPGLEEETGEWFEKVAALLDRLSGTVSPSFFFQNLWLVLITAPNSRTPALNYLARRLPRASADGDEALDAIVGHDVGLMVRGFAAALEDDKILVQRGILDLLIGTLRLDSAGFRSCRTDDQVLLTRAVLAVVLRRDLSLSRRLYTWLLGPSDSSASQLAFLRTHGLDLLARALSAEMRDGGARGFKVFISLLDKWEIGALLTERCVVDAATALRGKLAEGESDELLMTGNMLFEVLDPFLLWKQLFAAVRADLAGEANGAVDLARFVVRTFRMHDDEVLRLHAPVVAFALIDLVLEHLTPSSASSPPPPPATLAAALSLATELLAEVPPAFFASTTSPLPDQGTPPLTGAVLARALYAAPASDADAPDAAEAGAEADPALARAPLPPIDGRALLAAGLARALALVLRASCAADAAGLLLLPAAGAVELLLDLARAGPGPEVVRVQWNPDEWVAGALARFEREKAAVRAFEGDKALVRLVLRLSAGEEEDAAAAVVSPRVRGEGRVGEALAARLLAYLLPGAAPCYLEAVQLLWAVEALAPGRRILEGLIARRLGSEDALERERAFEAFGNLWRFTEDAQLPGVLLRNPMFATLDALKSDDLAVRRAAEAWMRCSLKSYIRVLDPLLFALLDPAIAPRAAMLKVGGVRVPVLEYERAFDQAKVHHVLDNLLALARFGGQGFVRIAKGSWLKHTLDPALRERVITADLETHTYLDGMIVLLLRFLRADPSDSLVPALAPLNSHIHAVVAELLQVLISRGESELVGLAAIESSLTVRLYLSIHRDELDLQNKLLHVLHSVIHASTTAPPRRGGHQQSPSAASTAHAQAANEAQPPDLTHDELFVRVLSDAIKQPSNAVIHHWIDFLLMTIPQFRHSLHSVILPLVDQLVARLDALVADFRACYVAAADVDLETASSATDAEFTVITNALERLLLIAVSESVPAAGEEESRAADRTAGDAGSSGGGGGGAGGLLGYMTGVLSHQELETGDVPEQVKTKHQTLQHVRDAVDLLLGAWDVTSALDAGVDDDRSSSQAHFAVRVRVRARRALERIYKAVPGDVMEDLVGYWSRTCSGHDETEQRVFAMLQVLQPSPKAVVAALCEKLNPKNAAPKHKSPYSPAEDVTFAFLEAYIERMEGPNAVQVWSAVLAFTRDVLSNQSSNRSLVFPTLRVFTSLSEKISQTSALEDRRLRRDLQETFVRLADATIQIAGRASESGSWLRKAAPEGGAANGDTDSVVSEKTKDERSSVLEAEKKAPAAAGERVFVREITEYLAQRVVPDLKRFLVDPDKTAGVCSNMVYYIISPAFKTRNKTFEADPAIFALLHEMTKNPQTLKAWRSLVGEAFADNRFFNAPPSANTSWKPLVQALMMSDKERFTELSSKISTASSANIFTNRELESLSRALSLRRLTYILLTGPKDRYLTQLPNIQEKVVDLLRSPVGDMVHAEVYLCLRVLFCRIDNQHLSGLWPVILTELLRLFDSLVDQTVPDGSDLLQLVFSACKFLDLTLVLQTEDFQIHEWMFVTDTVDVMYPPEHWLPQAIMDRLGEILSDPRPPGITNPATVGEPTAPVALEASAASHGGDGVAGPPARRPLLPTRRIRSIRELEPFFATVSLAAYESIYKAGSRVDWAAVEQSLERDVFEGKAVAGTAAP
ncbi:hypothetical protein JCM10449v2_002204 [Rhodotorula kratochvilovae]